jgi:carbon storage regulator CsrA
MLVLSRKIGERLIIGDDVEVVVSRVAGNRVTLGITAPADVAIKRAELAKDQPVTREPECGDAEAWMINHLECVTGIGITPNELAEAIQRVSMDHTAFNAALLEALREKGVLQPDDVLGRLPAVTARLDQFHAEAKRQLNIADGKPESA